MECWCTPVWGVWTLAPQRLCMNMSDKEFSRLGGRTSVGIYNYCVLMNISVSLFRSPADTTDSSRYSVLANQGYLDQSYDTISSLTPDSSPGKPLYASPQKMHGAATKKHFRPKISILNVNCQSVWAKKLQFQYMINRIQPYIVIGRKSWLHEKIK